MGILNDYFAGLTESLVSTLNTPDDYLNRIALSVTIIIIGLLLYILLKKVISGNISDYKKKFKVQRIIKSTMLTLTMLSVLFIWIQAINALVLFTLFFGVFIVFMVRGLTNNIVGFFVIKYRKYFKVGHRVEINGVIGDVIEINLVSFKLLESRNWLSSDSNTGRIIRLPNKIIFDESIEIIGITNTFVWHEVKYSLSFESDWHAAEQILIDVGDVYFKESVLPDLEDKNEHLPTDEAELRPVFSLNTDNEGIIVVLRYLVDYRNGTSVKTALQRRILNKFAENPNIGFSTLEVTLRGQEERS